MSSNAMSIELISSERTLPEYLHANRDGRGFKHGLNAVLAHCPFQKLPRGLMQRKGLLVYTPLFVYGYSVTDAELRTFAEAHDLLVTTTLIQQNCESDSEHSDDKSDDDLNPMDLVDTANKVFEHVHATLGITSFKLTWDAIRLRDLGVASAMVITTNWNFNRDILRDELDTLRRLWRPDEAPVWHPVVGKCSWIPKPPKRRV